MGSKNEGEKVKVQVNLSFAKAKEIGEGRIRYDWMATSGLAFGHPT
jgi:hypothetical protein